MDEDQWMHDSIMFEEVEMNEQNEDKASVNEEHVDSFLYTILTLYCVCFHRFH